MEIKHQSEVIEWLRFILAALVVFMHAPVIDIDNYSENINSGGVIPVLMILIKRGIGSVAVPTFFFISGYLFYLKLQDWDWDVFGKKIKKRIRTVLFPYVLWNVLTALFFILVIFASKRNLNAIWVFCSERGWGLMLWNNARYGESITFITNLFGVPMHNSAPIDGPLWFVRDLLVCFIFAPIIYRFLNKKVLSVLLVLLILNVWIPIEGFSIISVFYFSWGGYFSRKNLCFVNVFNKWKNYSYMISIVLLIGIMFSFGNNDSAYKIIWPLFTVSGVAATISIASFLLRNTFVTVHHNLANSSFFLFAAHFPLINYFAYLINHVFDGNSTFLHTAKYFAAPIILILILEICYFSMKRYSPCLLNHLTGGR